ncbi:hypothetical protein TRVA0_005S00122 [Trichomonascus vanleenenianus]|uniref:uncharacterized protein n=1 Tax=Trichomonascus vanleenenianus TaxID=2268995 RepID=UPI003ECAC5FF
MPPKRQITEIATSGEGPPPRRRRGRPPGSKNKKPSIGRCHKKSIQQKSPAVAVPQGAQGTRLPVPQLPVRETDENDPIDESNGDKEPLEVDPGELFLDLDDGENNDGTEIVPVGLDVLDDEANADDEALEELDAIDEREAVVEGEAIDLGTFLTKLRLHRSSTLAKARQGEPVVKQHGEYRTMIVDASNEIMPENTKRVYMPRIQQFTEWMAKNMPGYNGLINQDSAVIFMSEVMERTRKNDPTKIIGIRTVEAYQSALSKLYKIQRETMGNESKEIFPKGGAYSMYKDMFRRVTSAKRKAQYEDKGKYALFEGYNLVALRVMGSQSWDIQGREGIILRNRTQFFFCHNTLYRGDNSRRVDLSDLALFTVSHEAGQESSFQVVSCRSDQAKNNQYGRIHHAAVARNKEIEICLVSSLAMLLLWRFDLTSEGLPDFSRRETWYDVKLFITSKKKNTQAMSYETNKLGHKSVLETASDMQTDTVGKVTHNRASAVKHIVFMGVKLDDIKQYGGWAHESINEAYLPKVMLTAIRAFAGFHPQYGFYHLRRDAVEPPDELKKLIFPGVDELLVKQKEKNKGPEHQRDLAAEQFLKLLIELRRVILQDAAILIPLHPNRQIWKHKAFKHPSFGPFAEAVREAHYDTSLAHLPETERLKAVMPEIVAQFQHVHEHNAMHNSQMRNMSQVSDKQLEEMRRLDENMNSLSEEVANLGERMDMMQQMMQRSLQDILQVILSDRAGHRNLITGSRSKTWAKRMLHLQR